MTLKQTDGISPAMLQVLKKTRNLKPAMRRVELLVLQPMRVTEWASSGLKSRSGELRDAVQTFSGKKSAGLAVHSKPGHDLIIPKAITHTRGAKKHEFRKRQRSTVKSYHRAGRKVRGYVRRNRGGPWGAVPKRPFIPTAFNAAQQLRIRKILGEYIHV